MDYPQSLGIFALLVFGIIAVPGMDMLFVTTNALTGGRRAGLAATGGIMIGGVYHTVLGTIGTRVLLTLPGQVFIALQLAGAGYLAWIGLTLVRSTLSFAEDREALPRSPRVALRQGAITCVLNPKAYIFVLSVYPQFLRPQFGPLWAQGIAMGAVSLTFQFAVYGSLALLVSNGRNHLMSNPGISVFAGRLGGTVFIVVAVLSAVHAIV